MKEILMTCPFTGLDFSALVSEDGNITFQNPLTNEITTIRDIPLALFAHMKTYNRKQVQEVLGVSKQRVSQIIEAGIIPVHYVAGNPVFLAVEVEHYRDTRKVGRPEKEVK